MLNWVVDCSYSVGYMSNEMRNWQVGGNFEGMCHGVFKCMYYPVIRLERLRETTKISVSIGSNQADIRKGYFLNSSLDITAILTKCFFEGASERFRTVAWSENCKWYSSPPLGDFYLYFLSQCSELCHHNPLCRFLTSVYCCKRVFPYRLSPEAFGYILVNVTSVDVLIWD
jgi:hypothetical protein